MFCIKKYTFLNFPLHRNRLGEKNKEYVYLLTT